MNNYFSRRKFVRATALSSAGLMLSHLFAGAATTGTASPLHHLCNTLVRQWGAKLLSMQVTDKSRTDDYGGIWCAADKTVHGRIGDAIYPFFYLADATKDRRYTDAAMLLYQWTERRVSQPDGSWLNEPQKGSWQGTTVFMSAALGEALKNYGHLMADDFKQQLRLRLKKAGDYIYKNFNIEYGNINYPISAAYTLSLLGQLLDVPEFTARGRELAHTALQFFTKKDSLLFGEGEPYKTSAKGCHAIDLGYNVEESLPALVQYALLTKDEEVLTMVTRSLKSHLKFMLPDGGWDNSWGTRNYKWTYYGSRTSDGCQTAYALLAHRDASFYRAALRNTQLMQRTTVDGLLQGGPHFAVHNVPVCVHHTFTHIKSLVHVLGQPAGQMSHNSNHIPRDAEYGLHTFADIQTWLVSKGDFRATVTAYDEDYKHTKNGHATGGALSMLWHKRVGAILCASMNQYQVIEAGNQQTEDDPHAMPLTPRIEAQDGGNVYMNISDQTATVETSKSNNSVIIKTRSRLVDKDQKDPSSGLITCSVDYEFTAGRFSMHTRFEKGSFPGDVKLVIPVIARSDEKVIIKSNQINVARNGSVVVLKADCPLTVLPTTNGRVFNFVPGFEAVPVALDSNDVKITIEVI